MKTVLNVSVFICMWYCTLALMTVKNYISEDNGNVYDYQQEPILYRPKFVTTERIIKYFETPKATFRLLKPNGFSVSIPGHEAISTVEMKLQICEPVPEKEPPALYKFFKNNNNNRFCFEYPNLGMSDVIELYYLINITLVDGRSVIIANKTNATEITQYKRLI